MNPLLRAGMLLALAGCSLSPFAFDVDREEGVHGGVLVEWWYHFGWLSDEEGGEWAWFSSFFRYAPKDLPLSRYLIHDLVDLQTGRSEYRSRLGAEAMEPLKAFTGKAEPPPPHGVIPGRPAERAGDPLRLAYGDDRFERTGDRAYRLRVGPIDLELRAASEAMPVEGTGLTGLHRPDDMHYYTIPRLEAVGTVRGKKAKGVFWYDHQWGGSWVADHVGWSWWGLQLDDGTDVNAVVLRDVKTGATLRSVLTRGVRAWPMEARPGETWVSATGVRYPVTWDLAGGGLRLRIEPMFRDRECPVFGELKSIWEGPVRVSGSHGGRGFQELVGYARQGERR